MGIKDLVNEQAFTWKKSKDIKLHIYYYGKRIMIVKGMRAIELIEDLEVANLEEEQYLLARVTGNFKRGNEKLAKNKKRI